jgi:hypothetical protein
MSGRSSVLRGDIIELTAVFFDAAGDPADPTSLKIGIYPPGSNPELGAPTSEAWVYDITLTDGGLGPLADPAKTLERTGEGHYKYAFTVPGDSDVGSAFDKWEAVLDSEDIEAVFNFVIVGGGSVGTTKLYENNIVHIELDKSIGSLDGDTLGTTQRYYFTTTYNPLYASIRQLRLDLGSFVDDIPDDTINLSIYEAGRDADINSFQKIIPNMTYFRYVKDRYTLLMAELVLLRGLMGSPAANKLSKKLGDLSVFREGNMKMLEDRAEEVKEELDELRSSLRSGGATSTGSSMMPNVSVKGAYAPDAIVVGRQWEPTSGIGISSPRSAGNAKLAISGRRDLKTFSNRR